MKTKKIALIGGAGFIGHNLALSLKQRGHEPIIIDSLGVNNILSLTSRNTKFKKLYRSILNQRMDLLHDEDIELSIEDARNYEALCHYLHELNPDVIIHLAAVSHANLSIKDPHSTFDHNLRTLENALDFSKSANSSVQHFIYFSSSMVYGHFNGNDVNEETECRPLGIYGTLKYSGELILKSYNQVFGLPYTIIRPSALYGERCVSRRVSQIFIESALTGSGITINGDGSDMLDFTYIEDLIQGVTLAVEKEEAKNETFNITYGEGRSISELTNILREHFEGIKIKYEPKDKLTPNRGTLNVHKAKEMLGYQPQNPIEIGYPKYIQWYKSLYKKYISE